MQSKVKTVEEYIAELPADRRAAISAIRKVILKNLDRDLVEIMQYGMIGYAVPHRVFPPGYHCDPSQPLPYAGLASQKNHMSLYLMSTYGDTSEAAWFRSAWTAAGKKLDMGKACIRFKRLEDVPLDVVGQAIRRISAADYVSKYLSLTAMTSPKSSAKPLKKAAAASSTVKSDAAPAKKRPAGRSKGK